MDDSDEELLDYMESLFEEVDTLSRTYNDSIQEEKAGKQEVTEQKKIAEVSEVPIEPLSKTKDDIVEPVDNEAIDRPEHPINSSPQEQSLLDSLSSFSKTTSATGYDKHVSETNQTYKTVQDASNTTDDSISEDTRNVSDSSSCDTTHGARKRSWIFETKKVMDCSMKHAKYDNETVDEDITIVEPAKDMSSESEQIYTEKVHNNEMYSTFVDSSSNESEDSSDESKDVTVIHGESDVNKQDDNSEFVLKKRKRGLSLFDPQYANKILSPINAQHEDKHSDSIHVCTEDTPSILSKYVHRDNKSTCCSTPIIHTSEKDKLKAKKSILKFDGIRTEKQLSDLSSVYDTSNVEDLDELIREITAICDEGLNRDNDCTIVESEIDKHKISEIDIDELINSEIVYIESEMNDTLVAEEDVDEETHKMTENKAEMLETTNAVKSSNSSAERKELGRFKDVTAVVSFIEIVEDEDSGENEDLLGLDNMDDSDGYIDEDALKVLSKSGIVPDMPHKDKTVIAVNDKNIAAENIKQTKDTNIVNDKIIATENIKQTKDTNSVNDKTIAAKNIKQTKDTHIVNDKTIAAENIKQTKDTNIVNDKTIATENIKQTKDTNIVNDKTIAAKNIKQTKDTIIVNDKTIAAENIKQTKDTNSVNDKTIAAENIKQTQDSNSVNDKTIAAENIKQTKDTNSNKGVEFFKSTDKSTVKQPMPQIRNVKENTKSNINNATSMAKNQEKFKKTTKPKNPDMFDLKIMKYFDTSRCRLQDDSVEMHAARLRWRSTGVPDPETNLTVATAVRKQCLSIRQKLPTLHLEGKQICCMNLYENEMSNVRKVDCTPVDDVLHRLNTQRQRLEKMHYNAVHDIRSQMETDMEAMKAKHNRECSHLHHR